MLKMPCFVTKLLRITLFGYVFPLNLNLFKNLTNTTMKKLSTLVCVMLAGGLVQAQQSGIPVKPSAMTNLKKTMIMEKKDAQVSNNSGNRAVIWSDDFSTTSNWTMTNASVPSQNWVIGTALPTSLTAQGFDAAVNSVSGGNFAYIDSDGAGTTATQDASITTSGSIDLSAVSAAQLTFTNYHRRYQETHWVRISTDGGTTWTDFEVNGEYATSTTSPNPETVTVNIGCVAANQANVKVSFRYQGAYDWFWCVDDVMIEDADANEVRLLTPYFQSATANPYGDFPRVTIFPANEVQPMRHFGTLMNIGSDPQTGCKITATVLNPSNTPVYTGNGAGAALGTCTGNTLEDFPTTDYTSSGTVGAYKNIILANYDNMMMDATPNNNVDTLYHWVDNNQMAADDDTYKGNGLWNGDGNAYVMGNLFDFTNTHTAYSVDVALTGNTDAGVVICGQIYELDATTGDFILVNESCGTSNEVTVTSSEISSGGVITWVNLLLPTPQVLSAGSSYLAAVSHSGGTENTVIMLGGTGADTTTVFLLDGTDATWYYMTSIPMIRLNFDASIGIEENTASNMEVLQNMPNPANGTTRFSFNLLENAEVSFEMVDMTGKVVASTNMGNLAIGNHSMTMDVSNMASGVYFYTITANGQKVTRKMIVG